MSYSILCFFLADQYSSVIFKLSSGIIEEIHHAVKNHVVQHKFSVTDICWTTACLKGLFPLHVSISLTDIKGHNDHGDKINMNMNFAM